MAFDLSVPVPFMKIMNAPVPHRKQVSAKTISVSFREEFLRRRVLMSLFLLAITLLFYIGTKAQATATSSVITEIITDYGGYWKSNKSSLNPIKPDNTHNLLSFNYNGGRYSTGANDSLLTARGDKFVAGDYRALPVHASTGTVTSNTKIGLGAMYDGVYNGASAVKPVNDMPKYLNDGKNGLDLGTCVANIPAGVITFAVNNLRMNLVGDKIPDVLVTQVADPATNGLDSYEFADVNGNRVGNALDVVVANLHFLGNWTADFYEASTNPMTLSGGFAQTDRPIRIWAADFSDFGINSSNIGDVAYFRMRLNGNSDIAFVAYNNSAFQVGGLLPSKLTNFKGNVADDKVSLTWQTLTEQNTAKFIIESSRDGVNFQAVDSVNAAGTSFNAKNYSYTELNVQGGKVYYRLKMVDLNGTYTYSVVIAVNVTNNNYTTSSVSVYPNPAVSSMVIKHQQSTGHEVCTIRTIHGVALMQKTLTPGAVKTTFDVQSLPAGNYVAVISNGKDLVAEIFSKK